MKRIIITALILVLVLSMGALAFAQPGGGGRGGDDGVGQGGGAVLPDRPIPDAPPLATLDFNNTTPLIVTMSNQFQMPESWSEFDWDNFSVPTSAEDLEALVAQFEDYTDFNWDDFDWQALLQQESSPQAYAALVGFAETHLGTSIDVLYANATTSEMDAALTEQILAQMSGDVQSILGSLDGDSYYGLLNTGSAVVYTAEGCNGDGCSVDMDMLQFTITNFSAGAYAVYVNGDFVQSSSDAYTLIINTFPSLAYQNLEPTDADTGYAFMATDYSAANASAYYAGVVSEAGQTVVYVAAGFGDGYADFNRD